jgi:3-hydroxyisobutyrate dehydrogenase-like beta-hydroxyacid dehydrogenase
MPRKSRKNVGLIGLGIIGSRVAAGLRAAGFHVFVWNRSAKPAPNFVGSPAEVAELCEIVQIFVADAQALFDVIEQMKDVLTAQHVIICNSTVGPEATMEAARVVEEMGAHFLDAPFTGSKGAAEKRSLVYYIGGDESTFLRARPVLEATSKAIVRIGGIGHAATLKVVTNMIAAVSIQTLGEALAIVQKAGLDPEVLAAALEQNACRSPTMDLKLPKMIAGDYDPHFSLKHMFKDVQLGIHIANALDIEIPATTVTAGVMYGALNQGWGDLDYAALYKIYEPQSPGGATPEELQSGYAQIEDLDAKEVHYPETKIPAPPRPEAEPGGETEPEPAAEAQTESVVSEGIAPAAEPAAPRSEPEEEKKLEVPSLAAALSAPEEIQAPARSEPEPVVAEIPKIAEPTPPSAQVILPGHVPVPGTILLAPLDPSLAHPAGSIVLGGLEAAKESPAPAESEPEAAKVVEFPPTQNSARAENPSAEPAAAPANGAFDENGEENTKPFNFVKRWFVSRTGG